MYNNKKIENLTIYNTLYIIIILPIQRHHNDKVFQSSNKGRNI